MKFKMKIVPNAQYDMTLVGGSVYTYQSSDIGILQGSNDPNIGWVDIYSFTKANDSAVIMHSWTYLKYTGAGYLVQSQDS